MTEFVKQLIAAQFEAGLCTLQICISKCPAESWHAPVANLKYCQVAFHTIFFTDYYLGRTPDNFQAQSFHRQHVEFFSRLRRVGRPSPTAHLRSRHHDGLSGTLPFQGRPNVGGGHSRNTAG